VRCSFGAILRHVRAKKTIKLAGAIESMEVVAAAYMDCADEDLRDGHAAVRACNYLAAALHVTCHVDLSIPFRDNSFLAALQ
jgi:hypothetical protein